MSLNHLLPTLGNFKGQGFGTACAPSRSWVWLHTETASLLASLSLPRVENYKVTMAECPNALWGGTAQFSK